MDEFDFKKWLSKHSFWADPESMMFRTTIGSYGKSGEIVIVISDYNGNCTAEGRTLQEACENYNKKENELLKKNKSIEKLEPGMTKEEIIKSWGKPNHIHEFVSSSREHWFYEGFKLELQFEDEKIITGEMIKKMPR